MYWGLIGFFFILKDVTSLFCCSMSRLPVQLVLMMREIGSLWTRVVRWKGQKMEWLFFKESRKRQAVCYFPVEFNSSPKGKICFENYIIFITAIKKSKIKFCYLLQKVKDSLSQFAGTHLHSLEERGALSVCSKTQHSCWARTFMQPYLTIVLCAYHMASMSEL